MTNCVVTANRAGFSARRCQLVSLVRAFQRWNVNTSPRSAAINWHRAAAAAASQCRDHNVTQSATNANFATTPSGGILNGGMLTISRQHDQRFVVPLAQFRQRRDQQQRDGDCQNSTVNQLSGDGTGGQGGGITNYGSLEVIIVQLAATPPSRRWPLSMAKIHVTNSTISSNTVNSMAVAFGVELSSRINDRQLVNLKAASRQEGPARSGIPS